MSNLIPIPAFSDNYIWALIDNEKGSMICVDPGDAVPVQDYLNEHQLTLDTILLTHHHPDHIGGVAALKQQWPNCEIYSPDDSRITPSQHLLSDRDKLSVGGYTFNILFTPGHTSTHICYHEPEQDWLFCGDTLFSGGCGRVFDGTMEDLYASLKRLSTLPEDTQVFCAHEYTLSNLRFAAYIEPHNTVVQSYMATLLEEEAQYCSLPSTIALEKEINPFIRAAMQPGDNFEQFKALREQKDSF